ncbi:hypothetical protein COLO4_36684 [Corchorus olitorius]|uniref:FAR1 domain-containing protein n=1 Tax=Corchorus olitorius TaxID=93759 RepID=A0A1R3G6F4_9ROSI|nr:hypothetical protein COLO4_36684 [Corchorus olitorius]
MTSINGNLGSIQEGWEVDEHIYNAVEFELEKEDEDHEENKREGEHDKDNECEGEDDNETVTGAEIIVYVNEEEVSIKPHVGLPFDSKEETFDYYNKYAYQKGFSVRKGATRKSKKDGNVIGRRLVCSKEGFRHQKFKANEANKKRHQGETRCGCIAKLLINKSSDGSWVVSMFIEEHNHILATPRKCHLLPSHRKISESQKGMIDKMSKSGIKTNLMMNYLSGESHGSQNVGFIEGDRMYGKRKQWVPVYSRDFFCADMSTTQRSESINKFFKGFLSRKMLLMDFVQGVDKALVRRREKEIEADFKMNHVTIRESAIAKCKGSGERKKAFWETKHKKKKSNSASAKNSEKISAQAGTPIIADSFLSSSTVVVSCNGFVFWVHSNNNNTQLLETLAMRDQFKFVPTIGLGASCFTLATMGANQLDKPKDQ